jgi:hypothetical protein
MINLYSLNLTRVPYSSTETWEVLRTGPASQPCRPSAFIDSLAGRSTSILLWRFSLSLSLSLSPTQH